MGCKRVRYDLETKQLQKKKKKKVKTHVCKKQTKEASKFSRTMSMAKGVKQRVRQDLGRALIHLTRMKHQLHTCHYSKVLKKTCLKNR